MPGDSASAGILKDARRKFGRDPILGCHLTSHRDLGFCSVCLGPSEHNPRYGADMELAAWRLLAMSERGIPEQPFEAKRS